MAPGCGRSKTTLPTTARTWVHHPAAAVHPAWPGAPTNTIGRVVGSWCGSSGRVPLAASRLLSRQFCYFASFSYNNLDAQRGLQDTWGTIGNWQTEIGTLPWIGTLALVEELENLSDPEIRLRTIHSPPYWGLGMTTSSLKTN